MVFKNAKKDNGTPKNVDILIDVTAVLQKWLKQ